MKKIYKTISSNILERQEFLSDYKNLFNAYILHLVGDEYDEPPKEIGVRLCKVAQILVASDISNNIDVGIKIVDMFLELNPSYCEDLIIIAETVFAKIGAFPNIQLINRKWNDRKRLSCSMDHLITQEIHKSINSIDALGIEATNFQVDLWNNLTDGYDVVTIAPTSTGKSYIIMQYIIKSMIDAPNSNTYAVYIVPSRALIYEVSREIQKALHEKGIEDICVATVGQKGKDYKNKTIFVLTQERMLMLLHFQQLMNFSYIVVDEAQNISEGSRGVLLHIVLSEAISRGFGPVQLIFSSPSHNYKNTFTSLLGEKSQTLVTNHSPVSKNCIFVKCKGSMLIMRSQWPKVEITIPKRFKGTDYYKIVKRIGKSTINLVYSNTKKDCERFVQKLSAETVDEKANLAEASDYIRQTVHKDYTLVESIKKGIVFHYGALPRNIRIMIENYIKDELIDYTVCTSTLAEGINMPAKNLFIKDPKHPIRNAPDKPISSVQFKNIVGRAGRLMTHFSGNVFFVDYDKWNFKDYFVDNREEQKLPTYFKIINENTDELIAAMQGHEIENGIDKHALNASINKLLQDAHAGKLEGLLHNYVTPEAKKNIIEAIDDLLDKIELPAPILQLNPTVGIIQQHQLYRYLSHVDNFDTLMPILPKNKFFYNCLYKIISILYENNMFKCPSHIKNIDGYLHVVCIKVRNWVNEIPLREMIQLKIDRENQNNINNAVKETIGFIDTTIRFKLANAIKCFCDIYTFVAGEKEMDVDSIPEIYTYLEIGASNTATIGLISTGLTRQTAIEINHLMKDIDFDKEDLIIQIMTNNKYDQLHAITRKEIESLTH